MTMMRTTISLLFLFGCNPTQPRPPGGDDTPSPDAAEAPRCQEGTMTKTVDAVTSGNLTYSWSLDGALPDGLIAHTQNDAHDLQIAIVDTTGIHPIGSVPAAGGNYFKGAPLVRNGKRCIAGATSHGEVVFGCDDGQFEAQAIHALDAMVRPQVFADPDGTITMYAQTYAALTELVRSPQGGWFEYEQNQSSISYPSDLAIANGEPILCYITSDDHAVVRYQGHETSTGTTATYCKLAVDGTSLHVVTDGGYARLDLAALGTEPIFAVTPIAGLGARKASYVAMSNGQPFALDFTDRITTSTPLPTGDPKMLATAPMGDQSILEYDRITGAITIATVDLGYAPSGPQPETFTTTTLCTP